MSAARRWERLVRARLAEIEKLKAGAGSLGAEFWDRRARRFASRVAGTAGRDPFLARVRRRVGSATTVVDVGAGPGRFALALAPRAHEVIAVDPSREMLSLLRSEARRLGVGNVRTVTGRWEEVEASGDVVICSYVVPMIPDAAGFCRKLDAAARRRAFVYLNAVSGDVFLDPFWRHFHGRPRSPAPTYLDLAAVLSEIGAAPEIEVVEVPTMTRFKSLSEAVSSYRESLLLADTAEVRRELRGLLESFLVRRDGRLCPPMRTVPAAIVSWEPSG